MYALMNISRSIRDISQLCKLICGMGARFPFIGTLVRRFKCCLKGGLMSREGTKESYKRGAGTTRIATLFRRNSQVVVSGYSRAVRHLTILSSYLELSPDTTATGPHISSPPHKCTRHSSLSETRLKKVFRSPSALHSRISRLNLGNSPPPIAHKHLKAKIRRGASLPPEIVDFHRALCNIDVSTS